MPNPAKYNLRYCELLIKNQEFQKEGHNKNSYEYGLMKKELAKIEATLTAEDIIRHAEYLFPKVNNR